MGTFRASEVSGMSDLALGKDERDLVRFVSGMSGECPVGVR